MEINPVATVLTVYGIETCSSFSDVILDIRVVATVLTVYGIETLQSRRRICLVRYLLQQYLPFTVLKLKLKQIIQMDFLVATVLTVYGIETR